MNVAKFFVLLFLLAILAITSDCKGVSGRGFGGGRGTRGGTFGGSGSSGSNWFSGFFSKKSPSSSGKFYKSSQSKVSYGKLPAYSSRGNSPKTNAKPYGQSFGQQGLGGNTYIHNNYYGGGGYGGYGGGYGRGMGGNGMLTNMLLFGVGMQMGRSFGGHHSYRRNSWNEEDDRNWRHTTKAPYFENKVPGEHF